MQNSVPRAQCTYWPRLGRPYPRTRRKVHDKRPQESAVPEHQVAGAISRSRCRVQSTHSNIHAAHRLGNRLSLVVQEWHHRWADRRVAPGQPNPLVPHAR